MATDLTRITGSVPYVTVSDPTANPVEYVSEFIPLGNVVGDVVLNLSDGAYYEVVTAGYGTAAVLKRGDNQTALVVAAAPPTGIDGKSPYSAITDLIPTLTTSNGEITNVAYADNRGNPAKGYDYVAFANTLYDAVFRSMSGANLTAATGGTEYENFLANIAAFKAALADKPTRAIIEKWVVDGGLLDLILAGSAPFDDGDLFTDNVALEEGGIAYSSTLGVAAAAISGRNPQRGPWDYIVVPNSTKFVGALSPEIETLADLQASAYLPGRAVQVVIGNVDREGMEATAAEIADNNITKTTVAVYDKRAWKADESAYIGDIEVAWNGSSWVERDLTEPGVVTNLTASNVAATSLDLTWSNPVDLDLDAIIVRRATGATAPATATSGTNVAITGTPETVSVSGLTSDTQYSFSVFTRDADGNTSAAATVTASTTA